MLLSKTEHWLASSNCRQAISARNASSAVVVNVSFAADLLFCAAHSLRPYVRERLAGEVGRERAKPTQFGSSLAKASSEHLRALELWSISTYR